MTPTERKMADREHAMLTALDEAVSRARATRSPEVAQAVRDVQRLVWDYVGAS